MISRVAPPPIRLAVALLAAAFAAPATAQTVRGQVLEADDAPVASVVVVLHGERGERLRATLADAQGRFEVRVPAPGAYRLSAERAGYATAAPVSVEVPRGGVAGIVLRADSRRIVLPVVAARGRRRACDGELSGGARTAVLWEEARKALQAAALAEDEGRYRYRIRMERMRTNLHGRTLWGRALWHVESGGVPFASFSGEKLVREGYMQVLGDSVVFHGLTAAAILSDAFLGAHCFGVREGGEEHPGLVGLAFVPLRGRVLPDVRGVLWLDRASGELRFVEYSYTRLAFRGPTGGVGGRFDFRRLPNGVWVTWRWTIRAPLLHEDAESLALETFGRYRMAGFQVTSAEVLAVLEGDREVMDVFP